MLTLNTNVYPVVSDNGPSELVWFVASLHNFNSGVTWFWSTSFILSTVCSNKISIGLIAITSKKVSLFYVLERNLFLLFNWFYFLINLNPLYQYYLPLPTLFLILLFSRNIKNPLSSATKTILTPVVSDNGKSRNLFLQIWLLSFFRWS